MKRARQGILIKKGEYSYRCTACSETSSEVFSIIPVMQVQKKKKKKKEYEYLIGDIISSLLAFL